jgi:hypothetical protein
MSRVAKVGVRRIAEEVRLAGKVEERLISLSDVSEL